MKNPLVVTLIVCVSSFMIAAAIIKVAPYCEGDSECTFELAPYTISVLVFGFVGALLALLLCGYGIAVGMMRLVDWLIPTDPNRRD